MVHNDSSFLVRFRKTSGGVPFRIARLALLKKATIFFDFARLYNSMIPVTILISSFEGCLYLTVCDMTILHCQFTHGINVLWHNAFSWTFTTFNLELASATIEFIKPVFYSAIGWCFIDVLLS